MSQSSFHAALARAAEGIVLGSPEDLETLRVIRDALAEVSTHAVDPEVLGDELAARIAATKLCDALPVALELVDRLLTGATDDPDAALALVSASIGALQKFLVEGQDDEMSGLDEVIAQLLADRTPAAETTEAAPAPAPAPAPEPPAASGDAAGSESDDDEPDLTQPTQVNADPSLMADFILEATEHLEAVDNHLLTLEQNCRDAEALNAVFRSFHTIKGVAGFMELTLMQRLAHEAETMLDEARSGKLLLEGNALDLTFEANDAMKRLVANVKVALESDGMMPGDPTAPGLIERIRQQLAGGAPVPPVDDVDCGPSKVSSALRAQSGAADDGDSDDESGDASAPAEPTAAATPEVEIPATAPAAPPAPPADGARAPAANEKSKAQRATQGNTLRETIKVDADRLDDLIDSIGELVIAEAMVTQCDELDLSGTNRLPSLLSQMDKITRELQWMAMALRMVPIRATFQRMARLARDTAKKVGKDIDFCTSGDDTELDKTVVDSIGDPLVHLVHNAIDHGLESTEGRRAAGKPTRGRVELRAFHKGGSIHIEIEDDGGGLDREKILARAKERGLVREGEHLTDTEVHMLLFAPGFSTAAQVTDLSGRGVGLDVVKRNIEALRGRIEVRSEIGKGSVFSLRLPLTLAIIEGMVVRVQDQRYIVPTLSIVRMVQPKDKDLSAVFDRGRLVEINGRSVPLYRLDEMFDLRGERRDATECSVVLVELDERQYGLVVDELIGQQQIVIKPLGEALSGVPGLTGGAIMPDGRVALILDISGLVKIATARTANSEEAAAC